MNNFDCSVEIKQQSLSLPSSSSSSFDKYHDQSNIKDESEDLFKIARQKKFNLIIPSEHEEPNKKFRLLRKAFAIVCRSNMTRMQCNYRVTNSDRAWNAFLKKGQFIEFGEFRSVTSRAGTRRSKNIQDEHQQTSTTSSTQNQHFTLPKTSLIAEQIAQDIMIDIKISIENAMELANSQISAASQHEKNALLNTLQSLHLLVQQSIAQY
ncbi:unnamed protein product [Adineta steineri]|uniref:Uncharacterized protein n=1 Tax=Adineta steineri TaxID=433720 RepID=A0A819G1Y4_9BILA|nr:unnamed protein product [Adineta steineri]